MYFTYWPAFLPVIALYALKQFCFHDLTNYLQKSLYIEFCSLTHLYKKETPSLQIETGLMPR